MTFLNLFKTLFSLIKEMEATFEATEQEREMQRRQIIEEERLRLLKLNANKLPGNFPKVCMNKLDIIHRVQIKYISKLLLHLFLGHSP